MKPITNLLLLVALACYVFLPLFEISLVGNITGLQFTASMISAQQGAQYTAFVLIPFITIFLAIGFNSLKNRYWGIVVALLIFVTGILLERRPIGDLGRRGDGRGNASGRTGLGILR